MYGYLVPEGDLEEVVLKKILMWFNQKPENFVVLGPSYKGRRDKILNDFNKFMEIAKTAPVFVLVDLEQKYQCAPQLLQTVLPGQVLPGQVSPKLCFRIAVRTVECWLLADRKAFADFLGVGVRRIPIRPEELNEHPKDFIVKLARRSSKRDVRQRIVPEPGTGRTGKGYNGCLIEFVQKHRDPEVARQSAPSLDKALHCIQKALHGCKRQSVAG